MDISDELRWLKEGEEKKFVGVLYKGKIKVNIIAISSVGHRTPLVVMTSMQDLDKELSFYKKRMKMDQSFKDGKDKLGLRKIISKKRINAEKMISLLLILFCIPLLGVREFALIKALTIMKHFRFSYVRTPV